MSDLQDYNCKSQEFRKYLETNGVVDTLTKILVCLYEEPEKPTDALKFIQRHLSIGGGEGADVKALQTEVCELRDAVDRLNSEKVLLLNRISELEGKTDGGPKASR